MTPKQKSRGGSLTSQTKEKAEMTQTHLQGTANEDLKDFITRSLGSVVEKIKNSQKNLEELVQGKYDQLNQTVIKVVSDLSNVVVEMGKKVDEISIKFDSKMKDLQEKFVEVDAKNQEIENDVMMLQFKAMEYALRLRGIRENNRENLRTLCAKALAALLNLEDDQILACIERVYRVNSRVARQRNLPRDVVVYFTDRRLRNDILQKSYSATLKVEGLQIRVYKELPSRILKYRKDFGFLVKELNRRKIPFRWDVPVGVILSYQDVRYCLNTVEKAEHFYNNILKGAPIFSSSSMLSTMEEDIKDKESERETEEQCMQMELENQNNQSVSEEKGVLGGFSDDFIMDFPDLKVKHLRDSRDEELDLELLKQELKDKHIIRDEKQILVKQERPSIPQVEKHEEDKQQKVEVKGGNKLKTTETEVQQKLRLLMNH